MEFWATEVKSGDTFKVQPGDGMVLHLSQANLGEIKKEKGNESVNLFVNVDGKKLVLGTLSSEKLPQQQFDLVFDRDFELSHNWKSGNVYFFGYRATNPIDDDDEGADFDSDSEEDIPLTVENNGKPEVKAKEEKPTNAKKPDNEKDSAPKKGNTEKGTGIIKSEDNDSDDSMSDDEDTDLDEDGDDSDSEDEDDSEEETPAKVEPGKKRSPDSEPETPAASKKVKVTTPQKTDGKKGGAAHVATPHPSKQAGKTPATNPNQKTPKSGGGSHVCKSCSRTFGSEVGLESHTKAKHSAGK